MNLPLLIGSIIGVLVLAWAAWMLGLGGAAIPDEAEALRLAQDSDVAFVAEHAWVSTDRRSALVRGRDASWMVLKVHGAQVVTRRLRSLDARLVDGGITVTTGELMFGDVRLRLSAEDRDKLLAMV